MFSLNTITLLTTSLLYSTIAAIPLDLNATLVTRGPDGKCSVDWKLTELLPRPSGGRISTIGASLFDGYTPIKIDDRIRMQDLTWVGPDGGAGAPVDMEIPVELNEHAVFIHGIKGNNNMMIMWKKSPDNPEGSEWLDFYYGPPDAAELLMWNDLDRDVGYAGCVKGFWSYKDNYRSRIGSCWFRC